MLRIVSAETCEAAPDEAALSYQDVCADCIRHDGLCRKHERAVLPQLAQPFWYRHAHSGMYRELKDEKDHSAAGLKIKRRKERLRAKRMQEMAELVAA